MKRCWETSVRLWVITKLTNCFLTCSHKSGKNYNEVNGRKFSRSSEEQRFSVKHYWKSSNEAGNYYGTMGSETGFNVAEKGQGCEVEPLGHHQVQAYMMTWGTSILSWCHKRRIKWEWFIRNWDRVGFALWQIVGNEDRRDVWPKCFIGACKWFYAQRAEVNGIPSDWQLGQRTSFGNVRNLLNKIRWPNCWHFVPWKIHFKCSKKFLPQAVSLRYRS